MDRLRFHFETGVEAKRKNKGWVPCGGADQSSSSHQSDLELRLLIEHAAMEPVRSPFALNEYDVTYVHKENLGWDLRAARGNDALQLEVKSRSADSFTVVLTPNELSALRNKASFRLCIVCNTLSSLGVFVFKLADGGAQLQGGR